MAPNPPLSTRGILKTWLPLALSWLMLTVEQPILAAVVARSADPKVQLAAWGLAFSIILLLSAPSISMLAASTSLSRDRESYRRGRGYMLCWCAGLTTAHFLIAFTPLFDVVVLRLIGPPAELVEPVRTGVRLMLPFIPSLAVRRFQYGVLIRCDFTRLVSVGTLMRLVLEILLAVGLFLLTTWDGIVIASATISVGVLFEAVYATVRVRPVVRNNLVQLVPGGTPLTWNRFLRFYLPLVLTTFMQILLQPLVSASMSRMPDSLGSLALWPVLYGVLITTNSAAFAFVEAVIVLLERPGSIEALKRFTWQLGLALTAVPLILASTPLGGLWFEHVAALPLELGQQAALALWLIVPLPALATLTGLFQGTLINGQRTRSITEAFALSLTTVTLFLTLGTLWAARPCLADAESGGALLCEVSGVYIAIVALALGSTAGNIWLWRRAQRIYLSIRLRQARA